MNILDPLRRGAEELVDTLGEGWQWLRNRSASALTRFRGTHHDDDDHLVPFDTRVDRWGLLASDVSETDDEVIVRIEAPGLDDRDLSVSVEFDHLVVRGEKRFTREDRNARYHLVEAAYGAFERRLPLPCRVEADQAQARYKKGVVTVRLPRSEHDRRRRIAVTATH